MKQSEEKKKGERYYNKHECLKRDDKAEEALIKNNLVPSDLPSLE